VQPVFHRPPARRDGPGVPRAHRPDRQPTIAASRLPDQLAPIVRFNSAGEHIMESMRWGFPPPPNVTGRPVTNVRNTSSAYWRSWLNPRFRCLVPATSYCEYQEGSKVPTWFALGLERPLFAFAGIWRPWTGVRAREAGEHKLFAFLTTEANDVVGPVHAAAMPVVLTEPDWDTWLDAPTEIALELQDLRGPAELAIVARGQREDGLGA
jgi:putative SOS response-associated peptidase YedK